MTVDPVIAIGAAVAVGGFAYSLAEAYFRPWRERAETGKSTKRTLFDSFFGLTESERAETGKSTKLVIEPLDGGEGAEVVEYETPLTYDKAMELRDAIRRVESAQEARAEKASHAG